MNKLSVPSWKCDKAMAVKKVNNWHEFVALLETDFLDWNEYIFRGQRDSTWPLRSKFDREYRSAKNLLKFTDPLKGLNQQDKNLVEQQIPKIYLDARQDVLDRLLDSFKKACTGRRGQSPKSLSDIEWWALGQHFGLSTPLLDWTQSPYVAAYFALKDPCLDSNTDRAVWAYTHSGMVEIFTNSPGFDQQNSSQSDAIEIVFGLIDENSRIISQSGLFTKSPAGEDVEEFISDKINLTGMSPILYKIEIPSSQREAFLRHLEAMNIHAGSLFPDILGAAEFANRSLERESTDLLWKAQPSFIKRMLSNDAYHGDSDA
ncbi:MAG: hypothetical protein ACJAS1_004709 [Oleiphilaceae bacterium]|jgi:hypothetical protein